MTENPREQPSDRRFALFLQRGIAIVALAFWLIAMGSSAGRSGILLPFAWWDVALVYIACSFPIAWLLVRLFLLRFADNSLATSVTLAIGVVLLITFRLHLWRLVDIAAPLTLLQHESGITRSVAAMVAALGVVCLLAPFPNLAGQYPGDKSSVRWAFAILLLLLVPATYAIAKRDTNAKIAMDHLSQSRLAEGAERIRRGAVLNYADSYQGSPTGPLLDELDRAVSALTRRSNVPLPPACSLSQNINRATDFAMLGRRAEAVALLGPISQSPNFAASGGHQLLGTLYQDLQQWEASLIQFRAAANFWQAKPTSPNRQAALASSIRGCAFALRKLGRTNEAEAHYRQLLELAPTAEHHFLIAQFYEDVQEAVLATQHANAAIRLAPERYQSSGDALIAKMKANQFGCFQLFRR